LTVIFFAALMAACEQRLPDAAQPPGAAAATEPSITAAPIADDNGQWKIVGPDYVTFTVKAPAAQRAKILYRPVAGGDRYVELKTLDAPSSSAAGEFTARLRLPADFAGDVWAEAYYQDGSERDTQPISLAATTASANQGQPPSGDTAVTPAPPGSSTAPGSSTHAPDYSKPPPLDKSALSDEITGGRIDHASFQNAQPDIRIDVNVPAFQMCFWQNGKLVNVYEIGVGRKDFPIDISNRKISQIIFNPEWVPPDSSWVNKDPKVSPGEHIPATDSRNPLGKIKIPLGEGYLIHQSEKTADIGHLVSHGCIRMQQADLIDLAKKIIAAESLPVPADKMQHALDSDDRLAVAVKRPIPISIRYDTLVVQQGILHVYPDVYARGTNTVPALRTDLAAVGVDAQHVDDTTLSRMLDQANKDQEYVVAASDLKSGGGLIAGHAEPLTSQNKTSKYKQPASHARGTRAKTPRHARKARR